MPYQISKNGRKFCVKNEQTGESKGCSTTKGEALAHMRALYAAEAAVAEVQAFAKSPAPLQFDEDNQPIDITDYSDDDDDDDKLSPEDIDFLKAVQKAHNDLFPLLGQILNDSENDDVLMVAQAHIAEISQCAPRIAEWLKNGTTAGDDDDVENDDDAYSYLNVKDAESVNVTPSDADNPIAASEPEYNGPKFTLSERKWSGPIAFEDSYTGDNRKFAPEAITWDTCPLPFSWQKISGEGHGGSVVIGRVDSVWREGNALMAKGVVLEGLPEADEYLALIQAGAVGGVSVDGDSAKYEVTQSDDPSGKAAPSVNFNAMRIRGLTAVAIPAFSEAHVSMDEFTNKQLAEFTKLRKKHKVNSRSVTLKYAEQAGLTASVLIPVRPPQEWFANPQLDGPTALTTTEDGFVYGHLALWNTCHIGMPSCTRPPRGATYSYFHTGELETEEGKVISVGHLTFNTGHASIYDSPNKAAAHYDHTGAVAADVIAGEDQYGIWVAGALRPELSEEQIRTFRSAPLSGDWRRIGNRLELVAALSVNTPGFPVPRTRALVASGGTEADTIIVMTDEEDLVDLQERKEFRAFLLQKVHNIFADAKCKTEGGDCYPASDYAFVPDPELPSTWKLRLTSSPGGDPDPGIVGAAVAALFKGFRGNKVEIPSDKREEVIGKVKSAWLKANSDKTEEDLPDGLK